MANFWKDFWYGTEEAQKRDQAKVYQQQIMSSPDFDEGQKQNLVAAFSQGDVVKAEELAKYYKQKNQERAGLSAIKNIDTQLGSAQNNQNSQQQNLSGLVNNLQSKMSDTTSSNLSQLAQSPDFKQQLDQRINSLNQPSQTQQKPDLNQLANEEIYSKGLGQEPAVQDYLKSKQQTEVQSKLSQGVQQWVDNGAKPEELLVMLSNVGMPVEALKKSIDEYVDNKSSENIVDKQMNNIQTPDEKLQYAKDLAAFKAGSKPKATKVSSQEFNQESKLRNEYNNLSKSYSTVRDSYSRLDQAKNNPTAAGDLSLIFNYMKMLDPTSVVRESEYASAEKARGVPESVRNTYNKIIDGLILAPKQRADFVDRAYQLYKTAENIQNSMKEQYQQNASDYGISPERVVGSIYIGIGDNKKSKSKSDSNSQPNNAKSNNVIEELKKRAASGDNAAKNFLKQKGISY